MTPTVRTWFVTGAGRGLGRAFAEAALHAGDQVAATARDVGTLDALVELHGERVLPLRLDVADREVVFGAVGRAEATFGRLDVLVNNAGYGLAGAIEEVTEEQARRQLDVNLFGALWCTQAVLPVMRAQGEGHIFQISSIGGITAFPNTGLYHASKFALEGLSISLAQEVGPFGIKVTIVEPGLFRTDWNGTSLTRAAPMGVYDDVLRGRREALSGAHSGTQEGDPRRAARALIEVLESDAPPLRLPLGSRAADIAPAAFRRQIEEWSRWEAVARSTDFAD